LLFRMVFPKNGRIAGANPGGRRLSEVRGPFSVMR
jgi:hypothetical protein